MNKQELLQYVDQKFRPEQASPLPPFRIGDTVRVSVRIREGNNVRVQVFEGVLVAISGQGGSRNFTVRKVSFGVGVERIFPMSSPALEKVVIVRSSHVRRSKLYYLSSRSGKAARLEEKERSDKNVGGSSSSSAPAIEQELVGAQDK